MAGLLVLGVIVVVFLVYAADCLVKALARARRLRAMSERVKAAARAEEQQRQAEAAASGALTSVMPAINHPVLGSSREPAEAEVPIPDSKAPVDDAG